MIDTMQRCIITRCIITQRDSLQNKLLDNTQDIKLKLTKPITKNENTITFSDKLAQYMYA